MRPSIWLMHTFFLQKPQYYDLYGVVEHLGVPSNGHYVCIIRPSQTDWFLFDDSKEIYLQLVTFFVYISFKYMVLASKLSWCRL
jgi:ubiquitin C-terminal hydrolase